MLLTKDYNTTKIALDTGYTRQTVWDVINRKRIGNIRIRMSIARVLQEEGDEVEDTFKRIWGKSINFWFKDLI